MTTKQLPTGRAIFDPFASITEAPKAEPVAQDALAAANMESTSAMASEADNICPKCKAGMTIAQAQKVPVFYCSSCRVSNPMKVV